MAVNFLRYKPGNRMRIPIEFINADQSVDLRRGSFLIRVNRFIECVCDGDIPERITVDLTGVAKGDVIRLAALNLPPGVRPSLAVPQDYVVAVVRSAKSK
jgi:large subunit ribosomal protein L25